MKNLYYVIWADAINYERIKNGGRYHWKLFTFSYMSILLSLNLATLFSLIQFLSGHDLNEFTINAGQYLPFLSNQATDNLLWAIVNLYIPSMAINYFFVFYNRRYKFILSNYKFKNGRVLLVYFILSVVVFFGLSLLNKYLGSVSDVLNY